ncbi:MAG: hypothetical protein IKK89_09725 [Alistipes sp.]|nr:hypothetical protein [Alistipes sp.]MBR6632208.1 hypothetical protein [Alistipes sp.]
MLLLATAFVGCKETPEVPPTPIDPVDKPDFVIEVGAVTDTSVEFTITPEDKEMTYIAMMTTKEYFDKFEDDDAYIMDDLLWLDDAAFNAGVELSEYLEGVLKTGVISDTQDKLDPATEYIVYAFGLSKTGIVTTSLYKQSFTTLATELTEINFEIEVSEIGYDTAKVSVVPDNDKAIYFVNVFSYEDYEYYGGDESAFAEHLTQLRNYYYNLGATADQMVANLGFVGAKSLTVEKLKAGTKYMAYAIGIDERFIANSVATVVEFETVAAETSDLTFEVELTNIEYDHIEGSVTPSNNDDTYICSVQYASALEWSESEEALVESIVNDITAWGNIEDSLRKGVMSLDGISGLQSETDYIIVCFGYDGAPTTAPHITHFTTPEATGNPEDLVVEFEVSEITHNSVKVTTIPSVGVYYFTYYVEKAEFDLLIDDDYSVDARVAYLANYEIDYGAEWFDCSRAEYLYDLGASLGREKNFYNQLEPSTDYIAYAIAVDIQSGELASDKGFVSDVFRTLDKVVSDAAVTIEFGNYYDGSALAELDPARFLNCKGYAVLPYTVKPNDSAVAWYTGFYDGDFTEWGCTDDDIYAELITYGWEWGSEYVSENRESGVAVLSYDMPYTFLGIAKDSTDSYGLGFIDVITPTPDGVSPAEEFIAANPAASPAKAAKANAMKR